MIIALAVLSFILAILTFLPLVKDNFWLFRTLEYPRFQKFILVVFMLTIWLALYLIRGETELISIGLLVTCTIYLSVKIFPYTLLSKKEVATVKSADKENSIRLFTANVYQYNAEHEKLLAQIKQMDPDVILLLETNKRWMDATRELLQEYPHTLMEPLENTYGLLFYSRLSLSGAQVIYRVKNDIPSIEVKVALPSGQLVQLYGLHPEPPVPQESLRTTAKDKELMKVAFKVKDSQLPCIVLGDLNDVAWSYTTSLFTKISKLLDVRCGRGFYSTFSAKSRIMRFPLDYIFCSGHFGLYNMKRLPYNGSDHFPIYTHLVYRPDLKNEQKKKEKPDQQDMEDAKEMASK